MGITQFTYDTFKKHGALNRNVRMLELGDQNIYFGDNYGKYAKEYFILLGIKEHISVDLGAHEGGAIEHDLSKPIERPEWINYFDVVTNVGTSEHVSNLYECFKNVHKFCKPNGLMFHENPQTESWKGHGFHYMTQAFYIDLAALCGYEILDIGQHAAMGNTTDGWNIYCILKKLSDNEFITEKQFNQLDFRKS